MKNNRRNFSRILLVLSILVTFSCNLPGLETADNEENLRQTLDALSTAVAEKAEETVIPEKEGDITDEPVPTVADEAPTEVIPPTPIAHNLVPAQPGWVARWFSDTDSSRTSGENRAPGGDLFSKNIFERPFTSNEMIFRPDLDINKAEVSSDSNFIYFTIYLHGVNPETGGLSGSYGVELDTDLNGRGNYLVLINNPVGTEWQMENVAAYKDSGKKVGGARPMKDDPPSGYIGYDQVVFSLDNLIDPDAAWGRVSPKGTSIVEIAFKRGLVGGYGQFLWSVWADDGVKDPQKFDYNDHFTLSEAGSPYKDANYPLKSLALVDSTCREVFNVTPEGDIPGLCALPPTVTPTQRPTDPPPPSPGGITGSVFSDNNNNGSREAGEGPWCSGVSIWYHEGPCSGVGIISPIPMGGGCNFGISNLPAGQYCVSASGYEFTTPAQVTVNVPAGGNASVLFGIYVIP
jgi:hypothetical protein